MITAIIVGTTLAAAAAYFAVWLVRPDFRRRIESPKHDFQARLERYDRRYRARSGNTGVE